MHKNKSLFILYQVLNVEPSTAEQMASSVAVAAIDVVHSKGAYGT
jgi:hypothetical protein